MTEYFTISHRDTDESLGLGGPLSRSSCLAVLTGGGRSQPLKLHEWRVTKWIGDGRGDDDIVAQISADEFIHERGRI